VWWIGCRGAAADRVKRTLGGVFNLLQRVSGSLILTIMIINVERLHMLRFFLLLEDLAGKCNFIGHIKTQLSFACLLLFVRALTAMVGVRRHAGVQLAFSCTTINTHKNCISFEIVPLSHYCCCPIFKIKLKP